MRRSTAQGDGDLREAKRGPRDSRRKSNYTEHSRSPGQHHCPEHGPERRWIASIIWAS